MEDKPWYKIDHPLYLYFRFLFLLCTVAFSLLSFSFLLQDHLPFRSVAIRFTPGINSLFRSQSTVCVCVCLRILFQHNIYLTWYIGFHVERTRKIILRGRTSKDTAAPRRCDRALCYSTGLTYDKLVLLNARTLRARRSESYSWILLLCHFDAWILKLLFFILFHVYCIIYLYLIIKI